MKRFASHGAARRSLSSVLALALVISAVMIAPGASMGITNADIPGFPVISGGTIQDPAVTGPVVNAHRVYSISLAEGDTLAVGGGFQGDPSAVAAARIFDPSATSVLTTSPIAVAAEGTTTVQYTAPAAGTYYIDIMYSCTVAMGYQFMVFVQAGPGDTEPTVIFEPDVVSFDASSGTLPPASQIVTITIEGSFPTVDWWLFGNPWPSWLSIEPAGGVAPGVTAMEISVDASGLAPGDYSADIQVAVAMPSGPSSFSRIAGLPRAAVLPTSYGSLPVMLNVAGDGTIKLDCEIAGFNLSPAYPTRPSSATPRTTITGGLRAVGGIVETDSVLATQTVDIYRSYDNVSFSKVATVSTDTDGNFTMQVPVTKKTFFKAAFEGNDSLNASPASTVKTCLPYAYLTAPTTPSTVYKGRLFGMFGYVYPSHTSTYPVKLYFYRSERQSNGTYKWVYRKWAYGKRYVVSGSAVKYAGYRTSVPYAGKWRVRAVHTDADHKTSYSPFRYFTAR